MTDTADSTDSAATSPLLASPLLAPPAPSAASPQAQPISDDHSNNNLWRALGYYALGELSVGHTENALYAYRLLNALEPFEVRWKLGKAFCALNLREIAEAQSILDAVSQDAAFLTSAGEEKLLRQCRERLACLQRQSSTLLVDERPQGRVPADGGKVLRFPNATHS